MPFPRSCFSVNTIFSRVLLCQYGKMGGVFISGSSLLLETELVGAFSIINQKKVVVNKDCIRKGLFEKDVGI